MLHDEQAERAVAAALYHSLTAIKLVCETHHERGEEITQRYLITLKNTAKDVRSRWTSLRS